MSFQCYYKDKYLHLSYPNIENISEDSEEGWNVSISEMNKIFKVYDECEKMYLETDFYWKFPKIFLNFLKLKELKIEGIRLFDIDCTQIPESVEVLEIYSCNLNSNVLNGIEKLMNLKTIKLSIDILENNHIIFPNLTNIKEIYFYSDPFLGEEDIFNNNIFDNIRNRITKINNEYDMFKIYLDTNNNESNESIEINEINETNEAIQRKTKRKYGEKCACTGYPYMCNKHTTD